MASEVRLPADLPKLPEGWDWGALGSLVDPERGICYGIVQPGKPVAGGVPILRANDVKDGQVLVTGNLRVSPDIASRYRRSELRGGEILITLVGAYFGKVAVAPPAAAGFNTARAVGIVPVKTSTAFTSWALRSPLVRRYMHRWATTTAQPTFNLGDVARLPVPLPPLDEQRRIAAVLGALDDKIELNRKMNRTLEEMAQAIFKSWFIDFDGVPDSEMVESELGSIPKGWSVRSLFDSATYINGAAYRKFHFSDAPHALPIVKIAELKNGVYGQTKFTTTELADKYRINDREMLFSWSGNPDTSIDTFVWMGGPAWLNQHIFRVLPHAPADWYFVYYLLKHLKPVFAETARNKQTTGLGHVTGRDMKRLKVVHPNEQALSGFNATVGPLFERWYGNLLESRTLAALRDALLPKLISGEIRVPEAEKAVEEVI